MTARSEGKGIEMLVRPDQREAALWRQFRIEQDQRARRRLFALHQPFARTLARKEYRKRPSATDPGDYEQLAYEGLLQALDRYDPGSGVSFRRYAVKRILGNIRSGMARASEADAQYSYRYRVERDRLKSLMPMPRDDGDALAALSELAANLALGLILEGNAAEKDPDSLPSPGPSAYESLGWNRLRKDVAEQIDRLPEAEAFLVREHYLNGLSFGQIAVLLGLSKGRISQLHATALKRLGKQLSKYR